MHDRVPTYQWYKDNYGGSLSDERFVLLIGEAAAAVDQRLALFDLDALEEPELSAYRMAACAAAENIHEGPAVSHWSAGKESVTYADGIDWHTLDSAIERHLSGTRLACTWV